MANDRKAKEMGLVIGAKIRIGKKCAKETLFPAGKVIELVEGYFECYNSLYDEIQTAPSVWNESQKEYDSIYHMFGNDLENFLDSKVIESPIKE